MRRVVSHYSAPPLINKCLILDKENSYLPIFNSTVKAIAIRRTITQEDQKTLFIHGLIWMLQRPT